MIKIWKNEMRKSSITSVQTAMKNGLLGSDVIKGAMLQFTDLSFSGTWLIDDEVDSIKYWRVILVVRVDVFIVEAYS